jgi:hypothetical protein
MITLTLTVEERKDGLICAQMRPTETNPTENEGNTINQIAFAITTMMKINSMIEGNGSILEAQNEEGLESAMRIAGFKDGKPPSPPET